MAVEPQKSHRPGPLKQQNKAHKHGKHKSKGQLERETKGRVNVKVLSKKSRQSMKKAERRNQALQMRKQKRDEVLERKRNRGGTNTPPHFVVVVSLDRNIDTKVLLDLLKVADDSAVVKQNEQGILHLRGEEGQDAGGLLREWYLIISREIFNPNYALFKTSPGDRVTYTINPSSHCNSNHLSYFKFVGRIIAKAVYDNKLLECYFTRSFYKHLLGQPVKYTDMESEDYAFYQGLVFLLEHGVADLGYDLTFATEIMEFGVMETRDIIPNGRNVPVSEENKREYVKLVCQMKMTGAVRKQLNAFLEGFYDIIPKKLVSIFNEQELELLISGLPTVDIDDLKANSEYHKYQPNSLQIQWFWRALRSFDQAERANFLQFVTGTSKVPLQGFAFLEGMNGIQKFQIHRDDRSTDQLPTAHTCFNQLDLPAYETYDKLRHMLLLAVSECSEGFGLA